ncbi:MAG: YbjQ family protein [Bdellovibrionota bacterium]|jgi:uncharacterized protein YbjQ (UPF0145 family)
MDFYLLLCICLFIALVVGTLIEKWDYRKIRKREKALLPLPAVTFEEDVLEVRPIKDAKLVTGISVVASDFFKVFVGFLLSILGGRLSTYESILDRARRKALIKMKEQAGDADIIINTRLESVMLFNTKGRKRPIPKVSVLAYGTAITYEK